MTAATSVARLAAAGSRRGRIAPRWLATFLMFPPAGLLAVTVVDRVDGVLPALAGGAIAGAGIGLAQALALRPAVPGGAPVRWAAATVAAMAVGLAAGAFAVDHRTSLATLAIMGAVTGTFLGVAQGAVLHRSVGVPERWAIAWAALQPLLWAGGWTVTMLAGVDVERQYAVFGATGALTVAAAGAAFHHLTLDRREVVR